MKEKPPCKECQRIYKDKDEEPPCDTCLPELLPENSEVARVYLAVQNQILVSMGQIIDINHVAIKTIMDLYGVIDQRRCFERVVALFHYFLEEQKMGITKND
jgi:hypothetical protein